MVNRNNVKLKDVAKLANVSVGTVSRYINKHPSVSKKSASKIQDAIDKLGYIPNQLAQNLAKGISNNLLLYVLQENPILASTWLYELPIIQSIYDHIKGTGYSLQLAMDYLDDKEGINKFINENIYNKRADGMIVLSSWEIDNSNILKLTESGFPFVLIGNKSIVQPSNEILFDNYDAICQIVDYLYKLGHRSIGFINGFENQQHMIYRGKGYFDSIKRLGLAVNKEWLKNGAHSIKSGFNCMDEILNLKEQPTAVVCSNDNMAVGAIKAIKERGYSVPHDYSITGFDDSIIARIVEPNLTTVRIPLGILGEIAIERLIDVIKNPSDKITKQILSCEIVIGSSTSTPNA